MGLTVKLGIRALCEFVLQQGDIDSRFSGTDRAQDGARIHRMLQKRENYKAEVSFKAEKCLNDISYILQGRADGVFYKNGEAYIEEIKTTTVPTERLTEDFSRAHWAQGMCYALFLCENEQLEHASVMLTYYQADTAEITRHERHFTKQELECALYELLRLYEPWALRADSWRNVRNASVKVTAFPFGEYRKGQYELARAVYRCAQGGEILLACAPTGIGKTMSTLFPAIKALGEEHAEKIFYLTAKTITRTSAENAAALLRQNNTLRIKTLTLTAKDKVCFLEQRNCTPENCEYACGYYDRINSVLLQILEAEDDFKRENIEKYARQFKLCPFELALDLSLWCDIIICDYNYLFDPVVSLKRFFEKEKGEYIFLIDEAHNLADRARNMYSAGLSKSEVYAVKKALGKGRKALITSLTKINKFYIELKKECPVNETCINEECGKTLATLCESFNQAACKWLDENKEHEFHHDVLELYFAARFYLKIYELYSERYTTLVYHTHSDITVKLFCIDPSLFIRARLEAGISSALFSATLSPFEYFENTLGADGCKRISLYSPFDENNMCLLCAGYVSTKYDDREASLSTVANYINTVYSAKKGNYMAFFPSYKYMQQVYERYCELFPMVQVVTQSTSMSETEREEFLESFNEDTQNLGFCVLGGIFSEGIDLAGNRLIGTIIVGVGLPQIGAEQNELRRYYDEAFGDGFSYAYQLPGFNKVMQAAGRVIRSHTDKSVVMLIDSRYRSARYLQLFPPHWRNCKFIKSKSEAEQHLLRFWNGK